MALILVIDDDGFYLDVLRNVLSDEGHDVILAQGGVEGIALYQDRRRGRHSGRLHSRSSSRLLNRRDRRLAHAPGKYRR